jgi:hypothetical protein
MKSGWQRRSLESFCPDVPSRNNHSARRQFPTRCTLGGRPVAVILVEVSEVIVIFIDGAGQATPQIW